MYTFKTFENVANYICLFCSILIMVGGFAGLIVGNAMHLLTAFAGIILTVVFFAIIRNANKLGK